MEERVVIKRDGAVMVSEKEIKTMEMYSNGCIAKDVAKELRVSVRTVESYILRLKSRLDCATVTQVVCEFIRMGLIK